MDPESGLDIGRSELAFEEMFEEDNPPMLFRVFHRRSHSLKPEHKMRCVNYFTSWGAADQFVKWLEYRHHDTSDLVITKYEKKAIG